ncbi:MAG: class I SAM-dependent methyltransferase [Chloroflexota bacterium]
MEQSIQDKVRAQYGRQAALYSVSRSHASGNSLDALLAWATLHGTERVLDVAAGTGFCGMAFAPNVREVVAYDLTAEMLAEAARLAAGRGLTNMRFEQGPAEAMPFADASFDVVTCRVAPHHFASIARFMEESARVLRPNGLLLIADTAASGQAEPDAWQHRIELLRDPSHVRDRGQAEWRAFAEEARFADVEVVMSCWTQLTFRDWVKRSGSTPGVIATLYDLFANASPATVEAFHIQPQDGDDFAWEWPVACVRARKPENA